jgi:hypothetical protein
MATDGKIHFRCPHCDRGVSVAIQHAGKRAKCPGCGTPLQIPAAPPPQSGDLVDEQSAYPLLDEAPVPSRGPSLPLDLARRGWRPYKFKDSSVVVFLPTTMAAEFGPDGVLYGSTTGKEVEFSATLHGGFEGDASQALDFVAHLAKQRSLKIHDAGTYRWCYDPTDAPPKAVAPRFWVVGIPGAVVVISLTGTRKGPVSEILREVREEIPHIVGELM